MRAFASPPHGRHKPKKNLPGANRPWSQPFFNPEARGLIVSPEVVDPSS
jgi:hypothetical protein